MVTETGPSIAYDGSPVGQGYAVAISDIAGSGAAYYKTCAPNLDCTVLANWTVFQTVYQSGSGGYFSSVALNPDTPFEAVAPFLNDVDLVLCMTVFPGFGGQSFMAEVLDKVRQVRQAVDAGSLALDIEVDGGIDAETAPRAAEATPDRGRRPSASGRRSPDPEDLRPGQRPGQPPWPATRRPPRDRWRPCEHHVNVP